MKILITGAGGQLGQEFIRNSTLAMETGTEDMSFIPLTRRELDITDADSVERAFEKYRPDAVINCAAMTNVDMCENEPEKAMRINAEGAANVCRSAEKAGAVFVQLSTDFVFDGKAKQPYNENDSCSPVNVYGKSKLMSEELVRGITPSHIIIRTAWLYGRYGKSFVTAIMNKGGDNGEIRVVNDQYGCPTCTEELAKYILLLLKNGHFGTFHVCGRGVCTKYEFAKHIAEKGGFGSRVVPCATADYPSPAARPVYSAMDISKASAAAGYTSDCWQQVYDSYYSI